MKERLYSAVPRGAVVLLLSVVPGPFLSNAQERQSPTGDIIIMTGEKSGQHDVVVKLNYQIKIAALLTDSEEKREPMALGELTNLNEKPVELLQKVGVQPENLKRIKQSPNRRFFEFLQEIESKNVYVTILQDGSEKITLQPGGQMAAITPIGGDLSINNPAECVFFPFAGNSTKVIVTVTESYEAPDGKRYGAGTYEFTQGSLTPTLDSSRK